MPGGGACGEEALAEGCCAVVGGVPGCPAASGTVGCAPVTCAPGGFAGEAGPAPAAAASGALAFGADLQERTAAASSTAVLRMEPSKVGARILRWTRPLARLLAGVCLLQCASSASVSPTLRVGSRTPSLSPP